MSRQFISDTERQLIRKDLYQTNQVESIKLNDGKLRFFIKNCKDKKVLDLGCVDHNPENYKSGFWLHKAISAYASSCIGLDYYKDGVNYLNNAGFNVVSADAQNFDLNETYDVIAAGDLIEHLTNFDGFFYSCWRHLVNDGLLLISTPNPWCWKYIMYYAFNRKMNRINPEHTVWFCERTLQLMAKRFGFSVSSVSFCSRRWWEKIIPLPSHLKHTTVNMVLTKTDV